jgi:creatinine amidohydrolase
VRVVIGVLLLIVAAPTRATNQDLPFRWDELTASDWPKALEKAAYTAILPIGVLEKHGEAWPARADWL